MITTYDALDSEGKKALDDFGKLLYQIRKEIEFKEMGLKQAELNL